MKYSKIVSASLFFACATAFAPVASAEEQVPIELLNFARENGVEMSKPLAAVVVNKYPLAGKTLVLKGKLSVSGSLKYRGRTFPFNALAKNLYTQTVTYTFGQKDQNGFIPFGINHLGGSFDGHLIPTSKADQYTLTLDHPQGSILSAITQAARESTSDIWKSTVYSYTATATQKKVKGVPTTYLEVKEKAGFQFSYGGAVGKYTYSYDWKGALK